MKKRLRKAAAAIAILAGVLLCAGWIDCELNYTVQADNGNLAGRAVQFLNRGKQVPAGEEIRIYGSVDLGDARYVLMEYVQSGEPQLGTICLEKGLNGRYKIDHIGWGGGNFREKVVEEGGQKYYILGGRNAYFGISRAKIVFEGREYVLDVPEGERFLVYTEIDPAITKNYSDLDKLRFYDRAGEDITDQVPWN